MKLSIVILNYLTYQKTISCIDSLEYDSEVIDHIIIVDNASNNNSLSEINQFLKEKKLKSNYNSSIKDEKKEKFILMQSEDNIGYAKGNNLGISMALDCESDYILILNNDVKIYKGAVKQLLSFMMKTENAGCTGPIVKEGASYDYNYARKRLKWYDHFLLSGIISLFLPKKLLKHHFISYKKIPKLPYVVDMISGSCMLFKASVLKEIHGFDVNTFLYYEEAIICERLKKINSKTYVVPQSEIEHEHAGSTKMIKSTKIIKHSMNSQLYYLTRVRKYPVFIAHIIMLGQYLTYFLIFIRSFITKK